MNPEEKIKERRTVEAVKKDYMGRSGKFGVILRYMGQKIRTQGSPLHDVSYMEDPYDLHNEDDEIEEMGYFDEEDTSASLGWIFQGYERGMHLEIKYMRGTLSVDYKGYPVYKESYGDLKCFVPNKEWEDNIEQLYKVARKLEKEDKKQKKVEKEQKVEAVKMGFMEMMRKLWGI